MRLFPFSLINSTLVQQYVPYICFSRHFAGKPFYKRCKNLLRENRSAEKENVSCWMRLPIFNGGIPLFPGGDNHYHSAWWTMAPGCLIVSGNRECTINLFIQLVHFIKGLPCWTWHFAVIDSSGSLSSYWSATRVSVPVKCCPGPLQPGKRKQNCALNTL